jgi:hypothetical protein
MGTIVEIERAVKELSEKEYSMFRRWFNDYDHARWDAQIENDASNNRLAALSQQALQEYRSGTFTELPR